MPRLFFALWPGEPAREALAAWALQVAKAARGRAVPAAKVHLTLVFLGEVPESRVAAARQAAGRVLGRAFDLRLDHVGAFVRSGVAWAGCREPAPELLALQTSLERELAAEGFAPEARPFRPHLTLVRRSVAALGSPIFAPVSWRVTSFALVASDPRRDRYVTLAQWPLVTAMPPAAG